MVTDSATVTMESLGNYRASRGHLCVSTALLLNIDGGRYHVGKHHFWP